MFKTLLIIAVVAAGLYFGYEQFAPYLNRFLSHPTDPYAKDDSVAPAAPATRYSHETKSYTIRPAPSLDTPPNL